MKLTAPRTVWRLVRTPRAGSAFDGEGARVHGGRWNHPGVPAVYTAATLSLAALEILVHLEIDDAPDGWLAIPAELPEGLSVDALRADDLPAGWRSYPAPEELRDLGTRWLRSQRSSVLEVPSAVVPRECIYLLNPRHPDLEAIDIGAPEPFSFDPRLLPSG